MHDGAANIEEQCGVTTQGPTTRRPAGIMTTGYLILFNMEFCVSVFGNIVQEIFSVALLGKLDCAILIGSMVCFYPILHQATPPVPTN